MKRLQSLLPPPNGYASTSNKVGKVRGEPKGRSAAVKQAVVRQAKKTGHGRSHSKGYGEGFQQYSDNTREKRLLEQKASKYWGKRPARQVN